MQEEAHSLVILKVGDLQEIYLEERKEIVILCFPIYCDNAIRGGVVKGTTKEIPGEAVGQSSQELECTKKS